jgi:hypothetical protein
MTFAQGASRATSSRLLAMNSEAFIIPKHIDLGAKVESYAASARAWQGSDDAIGVGKHGFRKKDDNEETT